MKPPSYHILRVGMAITFIWVGVLILKDPAGWGGLIAPWAEKLLPGPIEQVMLSTAILDIVVGAMLLLDFWVWIAGFLVSAHLAVVLVTTGINAITVRDIGLLTGGLALMASSVPPSWIPWLGKKK